MDDASVGQAPIEQFPDLQDHEDQMAGFLSEMMGKSRATSILTVEVPSYGQDDKPILVEYRATRNGDDLHASANIIGTPGSPEQYDAVLRILTAVV